MKTCPGCGALYQPKEKRQVYCSKRCASVVANARQAELRKSDSSWLARWQTQWAKGSVKRFGTLIQPITLLPLVCPVCQQTFQPKDRLQKVCSHHCAAKKARAAQLAKKVQPHNTVPVTMAIRDESKNPKAELSPFTITRETMQAMQAAYGASGTRYEALSAKEQRKSDALILAGYGASLRVKDNALMVYPGRTHANQQATTKTYYRGMERPTHIILLKEMPAIISSDAMIWCKQQGISIHVLDIHGDEIQTLPASDKEDIRLRRKQYLLAGKEQATLARSLVEKKLRSQLDTLKQHQDVPRCQHAVTILHDALSWFEMKQPMVWLSRLDVLRAYEGRAAAAYFAAWVGLPLKWEKQTAKKIPPHWQRVRERSSTLSSNARHAIDPCNAILNYAYACLESQCKQALIAQGFDVACGILHADQQGRDSLVYDLMELYRAQVDALVLTFIKQTTFHAGDMTLGQNGSIRFHPELARFIVAKCRLAQQDIDQGACWLKQQMLATETKEAAYVG